MKKILFFSVKAQEIENPILPEEWSKGEVGFVNKLIQFALSWAFLIAILFFFFVFILGGIKWITAGGDENKVKAAKAQITNALIGLLVVFCLFAILKLIGLFFGLESLQELLIKVPTL